MGIAISNLAKTFKTGLVALTMLMSGPLSVCSEQIGDVAEIAAQLVPEKVQIALSEMPNEGRQLLALRSYLRSSEILEDRWSWTEAEIAAYQGTEAQLALQAEIDAVSERFAQTNPGYRIYVHSKVRSLDTQIEHWNENDSVGEAAKDIQAAWQKDGIDLSDPEAIAHAETWLKAYTPPKRAALAAPGLSRHGRAHAIDFQIMKDGEIIAATQSEQIDAVWRDDHWEEKLKASVDAAGPSFTGPLTSPHEPWHYDYALFAETEG